MRITGGEKFCVAKLAAKSGLLTRSMLPRLEVICNGSMRKSVDAIVEELESSSSEAINFSKLLIEAGFLWKFAAAHLLVFSKLVWLELAESVPSEPKCALSVGKRQTCGSGYVLTSKLLQEGEVPGDGGVASHGGGNSQFSLSIQVSSKMQRCAADSSLRKSVMWESIGLARSATARLVTCEIASLEVIAASVI